MNTTYANPYDLRAAGVKALQDVLGVENAQEFLELWRGIPGADFNKWLNEQPEKGMDEIEKEIMRLQEAEESIRRAEAVGA
jgi:hypothetical protein